MTRRIALLGILPLFFLRTFSQSSVTEIITDFGGYWKSGSSSINSIKPNNNHNLLAFTYNGSRFATGVNNSLLSGHGDAFTSTNFEGAALLSMSGAITSNTKAALGALVDGVLNGPSLSPLSNNISVYLSDGTRGLNLGTGVANLPSGNLFFQVNSINPLSIGDGIPDVLVTQIADPSGSTDTYRFTDAAGMAIGSAVSVNLATLPTVGNWSADFYEANLNPMSLTLGFTNTDRQLRLWAADFSDFGLTATDAPLIKRLRITTAGNSDIAFVAVNSASISGAALPVSLSIFKGRKTAEGNLLEWETLSESNTRLFTLERSANGQAFTDLTSFPAQGNSASRKQYQALDRGGINAAYYYRLRITDLDGSFSYSPIIKINQEKASGFSVFPNPARDHVSILFDPLPQQRWLRIYAANGTSQQTVEIAGGTREARINTRQLASGIYQAVMETSRGERTGVKSFIISR